MLLEATVVRCARNRAETKYDAECVNAREAAGRLAAIQEQARREELEAQSEQKRQALRRTQEAAAEARRRAAEAQRLREEAAYLGQFGATPPANDAAGTNANSAASAAAAQSDNTPGVQVAPPPESTPEDAAEEAPSDLEAIREELKRRQDQS
jgi:hypothetical protein